VNDDIVIFKRSEESIIEKLIDYDFEKNDDSYNYLLNINISKFSKTYIDKIEKDIAKLNKELDSIKKMSEMDMWLKELEELESNL
jgi:hypothetical protein